MEIIDFLFAKEQLLTTLVLLVLIALLIGNIIADKNRKYEILDTTGAIKLMDEEIIVLDVREEKERKNGHIANDTHIPLSKVAGQLNTLDKNKKVLVYCRSGARSAHICSVLTRNDFAQVYNLKGGITAWKKANLPTTT
jgi:rhodanese-related sulfurtransferase